MTTQFTELLAHWTPVAPLLSLRSDEEHAIAVQRLNELVDEVGTDERHPLYSFLDTLGTLIEAYETRQSPIPDSSAPDVLRFLMQEHDLQPVDLEELGPPAEVSRILAGSLALTLVQVQTLAKRFGVSPAAFIASASAG